LITAADGVWFNGGHVGNTTVANVGFINGTSGYGGNLNLVWFTGFMMDEGIGQAISFSGNTNTTCGSIKFTACTVKGALLSDYGVITTTTAFYDSVSFVDCDIREHGLHGVFIQSPDCRRWSFTNCHVQGNGNDTPSTYSGYALASGVRDIQITGGRAGGKNADPAAAGVTAYGITCVGTVTNLQIDGVDVRGNAVSDLNIPAAGVLLSNCLTDVSSSVASASTIALPQAHDFVTITGTTGIATITASRSGRLVTLIFSGVLTVTDGSNLKLAGNFTTTADDTLTLRSDGTNWIEVARSVN
jgi:hypothetical protein